MSHMSFMSLGRLRPRRNSGPNIFMTVSDILLLVFLYILITDITLKSKKERKQNPNFHPDSLVSPSLSHARS